MCSRFITVFVLYDVVIEKLKITNIASANKKNFNHLL
jgi:hypothetical protein